MTGLRQPIEALRQPGPLVALLTLAAVCVDSALVPELNTVAPAASCTLLLLLVLRRGPPDSTAIDGQVAESGLAKWRILLFFAIHLAIITAKVPLGSLWNGNHSTTASVILAAAKYLIVLIPTAVLLPPAGWRLFKHVYRTEWIAAAIALSFYPYRIFSMAWPWYGRVLGRFVYVLAQPFASSIHYVPALNPMLLGPNLDVTIVFGCGGLQGIRLFQILFALVLVLDWNSLNHARALAAYFGGLIAMLLANAFRIALLFDLGNTGLQNRVVEYHLTGGWVLFTLAFIGYLLIVYRWMLKPSQNSDAASRVAVPTAAHSIL